MGRRWACCGQINMQLSAGACHFAFDRLNPRLIFVAQVLFIQPDRRSMTAPARQSAKLVTGMNAGENPVKTARG